MARETILGKFINQLIRDNLNQFGYNNHGLSGVFKRADWVDKPDDNVTPLALNYYGTNSDITTCIRRIKRYQPELYNQIYPYIDRELNVITKESIDRETEITRKNIIQFDSIHEEEVEKLNKSKLKTKAKRVRDVKIAYEKIKKQRVDRLERLEKELKLVQEKIDQPIV